MNGRFVITDHALKRLRRRLMDKGATIVDIGRMLSEAKVTKREVIDGELFLYASLEDVVFALKKVGDSEYVVLTTMLAAGFNKYRHGVQQIAANWGRLSR